MAIVFAEGFQKMDIRNDNAAITEVDLGIRVYANKIRCCVCNRLVLPNMWGTLPTPVLDVVCQYSCEAVYNLNPLVYEKLGGPVTAFKLMGWE